MNVRYHVIAVKSANPIFCQHRRLFQRISGTINTSLPHYGVVEHSDTASILSCRSWVAQLEWQEVRLTFFCMTRWSMAHFVTILFASLVRFTVGLRNRHKRASHVIVTVRLIPECYLRPCYGHTYSKSRKANKTDRPTCVIATVWAWRGFCFHLLQAEISSCVCKRIKSSFRVEQSVFQSYAGRLRNFNPLVGFIVKSPHVGNAW